MSTSPVVTITDELIAELEAAANACCPMFLDSAETLTPADSEGYASLENDYCNFDNHAIGVQFYGIGGEFGAGERYFRAASPAVIRALLAERAELKRDAERYRHASKRESSGDVDICICKVVWNSSGTAGYVVLAGDNAHTAIDAAMQAAQ